MRVAILGGEFQVLFAKESTRRSSILGVEKCQYRSGQSRGENLEWSHLPGSNVFRPAFHSEASGYIVSCAGQRPVTVRLEADKACRFCSTSYCARPHAIDSDFFAPAHAGSAGDLHSIERVHGIWFHENETSSRQQQSPSSVKIWFYGMQVVQDEETSHDIVGALQAFRHLENVANLDPDPRQFACVFLAHRGEFRGKLDRRQWAIVLREQDGKTPHSSTPFANGFSNLKPDGVRGFAEMPAHIGRVAGQHADRSPSRVVGSLFLDLRARSLFSCGTDWSGSQAILLRAPSRPKGPSKAHPQALCSKCLAQGEHPFVPALSIAIAGRSLRPRRARHGHADVVPPRRGNDR
jgi:hypothetical protein